jgi:hypothetical protein
MAIAGAAAAAVEVAGAAVETEVAGAGWSGEKSALVLEHVGADDAESAKVVRFAVAAGAGAGAEARADVEIVG